MKKLFIFFCLIFIAVQSAMPGFSFAYGGVLLLMALFVVFFGVKSYNSTKTFFGEGLIFAFSFLFPSLFLFFYLSSGFVFNVWLEALLIIVGCMQIFFLIRIPLIRSK